MVLSFLVSLPIACFGYFFEAIFMHLATGVLIDWWYFEFKGAKESDVTPPGWLDRVGLTRQQLDLHSTVYMWLRHGAFFVSCMAIVADMFFKFGINFAVTFGAAYYAFRFMSGFYLAYKKMIYPWIAAEAQINGKKSNNTDRQYSSVFDSTNPYELSNTMGYTNPISPNYIYREN